MTRPTRPPIDSGVNGWDADVNDGFIQLYDRPIPIVVHSGDLASLETARPAAQYEWCLAIVDFNSTASPGKHLAFSNGTAWKMVSNAEFTGRRKRRSVSGATSITIDDDILVVTGASAKNITLPAITNGLDGWSVRIKNNGTGTITVLRSGSDTIDGATSFSIPTQYMAFEFCADFANTNWEVY